MFHSNAIPIRINGILTWGITGIKQDKSAEGRKDKIFYRERRYQNMTNYKVKVLTIEEATEILRAAGLSISPDTLRRGIKQGVYLFGTCIEGAKQPIFHVYEKLMEEWMKKRGEIDEPSTRDQATP